MRRSALAFALLFIPALAARAAYFPVSYEEAIALVKASPHLAIQKTGVAPANGYDPETHPFVAILDRTLGSGSNGFLTPEFAVSGDMTTGATVLAIPLESGTSGGIFTQLVFVREKGASAFSYAGHIDSQGHLAVSVTRGVIIARMPDYAADPTCSCCPVGYTTTSYDIENGRVHEIDEKTESGGEPIGDPTPAPPPI